MLFGAEDFAGSRPAEEFVEAQQEQLQRGKRRLAALLQQAREIVRGVCIAEMTRAGCEVALAEVEHEMAELEIEEAEIEHAKAPSPPPLPMMPMLPLLPALPSLPLMPSFDVTADEGASAEGVPNLPLWLDDVAEAAEAAEAAETAAAAEAAEAEAAEAVEAPIAAEGGGEAAGGAVEVEASPATRKKKRRALEAGAWASDSPEPPRAMTWQWHSYEQMESHLEAHGRMRRFLRLADCLLATALDQAALTALLGLASNLTRRRASLAPAAPATSAMLELAPLDVIALLRPGGGEEAVDAMLRTGNKSGKRRVIIPNIKHVKLAAQNAEAKIVMPTRHERRHLTLATAWSHEYDTLSDAAREAAAVAADKICRIPRARHMPLSSGGGGGVGGFLTALDETEEPEEPEEPELADGDEEVPAVLDVCLEVVAEDVEREAAAWGAKGRWGQLSMHVVGIDLEEREPSGCVLLGPVPIRASPGPEAVIDLVAGLGETLLDAVMALGLASDCAALRPFADPLETSAHRPPPPHIDSDDEDIDGLVAALLDQEPLTPRAVGRAAERVVAAGRVSPVRLEFEADGAVGVKAMEGVAAECWSERAERRREEARGGADGGAVLGSVAGESETDAAAQRWAAARAERDAARRLAILSQPSLLLSRATLEESVDAAYNVVTAHASHFGPICALHAACARLLHNGTLQEEELSCVPLRALHAALHALDGQCALYRALPPSRTLGLVAAKTHPLCEAMLPAAQACISAIESELPALLRRHANALHEQLKEAQAQSLEAVSTTAEHATYLVTLRDMGPRLERLEAGFEQATQLFMLAEARGLRPKMIEDGIGEIDRPTVKLLQKQLPAELTVCQDELVSAESAERGSRTQWSVAIEQEMRQIEADGMQLLQVSQSEELAAPSAEPAKVLEHVEQLWAQLTALLERTSQHQLHRKLMDMSPAQMKTNLSAATERLEAQRALWRALLGWDRARGAWMDNPLSSLHPPQVESELRGYRRTCSDNGLGPVLQFSGAMAKLEREVTEMEGALPLLLCLRVEGLEASHWTQIDGLASAPLPPGVHLTLRACLAASLLDALPRVHAITRSAAQTAAHRAKLAGLAAHWAAVPLRFATSDGGGPYGGAHKGSTKRLAAEELPALLDADSLLTQLEECTLEVQAVLGSAHLGPLHDVALAWLGRLRGAHAALHRWLDAERGAAHIARIAAACPELSRVAPEAAKLLPIAEAALKGLAAEAQECEQGALASRGALEVLGDGKTHEALARVAEALGPLHAAVLKGLAAKRQACPRLHALGDSKLLTLLTLE